jgi:hypothetical protein
MRWTVTCRNEATNELSDIWVNAANRQEVTRAADTIDRGLRQDPPGRAMDDGHQRSWTVGPLTVWDRVSPDDCMVEILRYTSP